MRVPGKGLRSRVEGLGFGFAGLSFRKQGFKVEGAGLTATVLLSRLQV